MEEGVGEGDITTKMAATVTGVRGVETTMISVVKEETDVTRSEGRSEEMTTDRSDGPNGRGSKTGTTSDRDTGAHSVS